MEIEIEIHALVFGGLTALGGRILVRGVGGVGTIVTVGGVGTIVTVEEMVCQNKHPGRLIRLGGLNLEGAAESRIVVRIDEEIHNNIDPGLQNRVSHFSPNFTKLAGQKICGYLWYFHGKSEFSEFSRAI